MTPTGNSNCESGCCKVLKWFSVLTICVLYLATLLLYNENHSTIGSFIYEPQDDNMTTVAQYSSNVDTTEQGSMTPLCYASQFISETRDAEDKLTSSTLELLAGCRNVLYLRNPKCGSRGVRDVFQELARRYDFDTIGCGARQMNDLVEKRYRSNQTHRPYVITAHKTYNNYTHYWPNEPVLIDVIRDPIDQATSIFSWRKYGCKVSDHGRPPPTTPRHNQTLDGCIANKGAGQCERFPYTALRYLGGRPERSLEGLQDAKRNLEAGYLLVGLTEHLPEFFEILETYLPRIFLNATDIYEERYLQAVDNWGSIQKETVNATSRRKYEELFVYDYDLYNFAKARMFNQLDKVRKYNARLTS